jgi:hypothetical protein
VCGRLTVLNLPVFLTWLSQICDPRYSGALAPPDPATGTAHGTRRRALNFLPSTMESPRWLSLRLHKKKDKNKEGRERCTSRRTTKPTASYWRTARSGKSGLPTLPRPCNGEPSSDLEVREIEDDEVCTHALVDRTHGTCVRIFEAAEDWVPEQMDAWLVS